MNKFYVSDGTVVYFSTVKELVTHLESIVKRKTGKSRAEWMQHLIDLGHGYDDSAGMIFTQSLAEMVNIGVVRDGKLVRCNVHDTDSFKSPEYGD